MLRHTLSLATLLAFTASASGAEATLSAQPGASVSFTAAGPAGMKIVGNTSELTATDDGQTVTISVAMAHLATGIELRDKHMREKYLEVQTYPTAVLTVPRAALVFPAVGATHAADTQGTVTLHGQTRPSTFHYVATNTAGAYRVDATVHVNMRDFGITVPNYLGVTVKPDVDVDVHFTATDR
jgi:polyisoprenoid-binding protein YceI